MDLFEVTVSFLDPSQAVMTIQAEDEEQAKRLVLERMSELPQLEVISVDKITMEKLQEHMKDVTLN